MAADNRTLIVIAALAALPPTIASTGALIVSLRAAEKVDNVAEKVEVVHKATNSMKDAIIAVTRSDALQEGYTKGKTDQKAADAQKGKTP